MKVLHVSKVTGIGGSERHLLELLPALAERGVDVTMCVLAGGDSDRFTHALSATGTPTASIEAGPDANPLLIAKLRRVLRDVAPAIVHTHLVHADLYGGLAAATTRIPRIRSVHAAHPSVGRQPSLALHRLAARRTARTIVISHHVERFVERLRLADPMGVRVIHYGIRTDGWVLPSDEREAARRELGCAPEDVVAGIASRLFPHKGHDFAIEGFARAVRSEPSLKLLIAGDGPLRRELEAMVPADLTHRIHFVGFVEDIRRFMNASDLLLFPTMPGFGEGFGLAALEGMAARRCVVATDLDSLPEIVVDGVTGALVPPGDVARLAAALIELGRDPGKRELLGEAAYARAREEFGFDKMVDSTVRVYEEMA
ncbi:MAG TPA: glycosyltransferase family 4 protein [Actinomycetota bacterium]|nr:glycosyltransferase family 4 protein [Actinomycetota bacterium]